jgi:hypothetical protein
LNQLNQILATLAMIIALLARPIVWICFLLLSVGIGYLVLKFLSSKGVSRNRSLSISALIIAVIIYIPFGDYLHIRNKLSQLNAREGGLKVYRSVSGVEGVHGLRNGVQFGYKYGEIFEGKEPQRYLVRYFKNSEENIRQRRGLYSRQKVNAVTTYGARSSQQQVEGIIFKRVLVTYVVNTGEILGEYSTFYSDPSHKGISFNAFRPWMKMDMGEGNFGDMKLLLGKTLLPAQS